MLLFVSAISITGSSITCTVFLKIHVLHSKQTEDEEISDLLKHQRGDLNPDSPVSAPSVPSTILWKNYYFAFRDFYVCVTFLDISLANSQICIAQSPAQAAMISGDLTLFQLLEESPWPNSVNV